MVSVLLQSLELGKLRHNFLIMAMILLFCENMRFHNVPSQLYQIWGDSSCENQDLSAGNTTLRVCDYSASLDSTDSISVRDYSGDIN